MSSEWADYAAWQRREGAMHETTERQAGRFLDLQLAATLGYRAEGFDHCGVAMWGVRSPDGILTVDPTARGNEDAQLALVPHFSTDDGAVVRLMGDLFRVGWSAMLMAYDDGDPEPWYVASVAREGAAFTDTEHVSESAATAPLALSRAAAAALGIAP